MHYGCVEESEKVLIKEESEAEEVDSWATLCWVLGYIFAINLIAQDHNGSSMRKLLVMLLSSSSSGAFSSLGPPSLV